MISSTSPTMSTFLDFFLKMPSFCFFFSGSTMFFPKSRLSFSTFMCPFGVSVGSENSRFLTSCFFAFFSPAPAPGRDCSFTQLSTRLTGISWCLCAGCTLLGERTLSRAEGEPSASAQSRKSPREGALSKMLMACSVVCENSRSRASRPINAPILGSMRGWRRTSAMEGRRAGSTCSISATSRRMSLEQCLGTGKCSPLEILRARTGSELASKGGRRRHISRRMTPSDQMSALKEYSLFSQISGDMQQGVPTTLLVFWIVCCRCRAIPKSPSFTAPSAVRKTFCAFRSRWMILRSWTCLIARHICVNHFRICSSASGVSAWRASRMRWARSPPWAKAITMLRQPSRLWKEARNLMMKSLSSASRMCASRTDSPISSSVSPTISICFSTHSSPVCRFSAKQHFPYVPSPSSRSFWQLSIYIQIIIAFPSAPSRRTPPRKQKRSSRGVIRTIWSLECYLKYIQKDLEKYLKMGNIAEASPAAQNNAVSEQPMPSAETECKAIASHEKTNEQGSSRPRPRNPLGKRQSAVRFHPQIHDSSSEEEQDLQKISKNRENRVLRMVKKIIGEQNIDFNQEQVLMGLVSKGDRALPEDKPVRAYLQHLQEEYAKRTKDKKNLGQNYIQKMVRQKMYEEELMSENRGVFRDFSDGSRSNA